VFHPDILLTSAQTHQNDFKPQRRSVSSKYDVFAIQGRLQFRLFQINLLEQGLDSLSGSSQLHNPTCIDQHQPFNFPSFKSQTDLRLISVLSLVKNEEVIVKAVSVYVVPELLVTVPKRLYI
jgi:hypothetical protein